MEYLKNIVMHYMCADSAGRDQLISPIATVLHFSPDEVCACVCLCVCVREREHVFACNVCSVFKFPHFPNNISTSHLNKKVD